MEVTAVCFQIFMNGCFLLSTQPTLSYTVTNPAFPIISPDRLQFFEYQSIFINCDGHKDRNGWKVMRKLFTIIPANESKPCSIPAPSCTIPYSLERHSGEYWCENDKGKRSHAVNISVTAGAVILIVPARPVKEGSDVTLRCIKRNTKKTHNNDFYKDGSHLGTYETNLALFKVSKADEGLYNCSIPDAGKSPESWLAVVKPTEEEDLFPQCAKSVVLGHSLLRLCHLMVMCAYCVITGRLIFIYCCREPGYRAVDTMEMTEC